MRLSKVVIKNFRCLPFATEQDEARDVAADIQSRHKDRCSRVVVLARNKAILENVRVALTELGVGAVLSQRRDRFASPHFQWLPAALNLAVRRQDVAELGRLTSTLFALATVKLDSEEIAVRCARDRTDLLSATVDEVTSADSGSEVARLLHWLA